jgi:hypothetical protein
MVNNMVMSDIVEEELALPSKKASVGGTNGTVLKRPLLFAEAQELRNVCWIYITIFT